MTLEPVFEHRQPIPASPKHTRGALWHELVRFVEKPQCYTDFVKGCDITPSGKDSFERTLHFDGINVKDTVRLTEGEEVLFLTEAGPTMPASMLQITIEAEEDSSFTLRFAYRESFFKGVSDNRSLMAIRKNAWLQKDEDTVKKMLQRLAAS